jgi:hypothetical protein
MYPQYNNNMIIKIKSTLFRHFYPKTNDPLQTGASAHSLLVSALTTGSKISVRSSSSKVYPRRMSCDARGLEEGMLPRDIWYPPISCQKATNL